MTRRALWSMPSLGAYKSCTLQSPQLGEGFFICLLPCSKFPLWGNNPYYFLFDS